MKLPLEDEHGQVQGSDVMNRLDLVPWAVRSDMRHHLKYDGDDCYTIRDSLIDGRLSLDGMIQDLDRIITNLDTMRARLRKWLPAEGR